MAASDEIMDGEVKLVGSYFDKQSQRITRLRNL